MGVKGLQKPKQNQQHYLYLFTLLDGVQHVAATGQAQLAHETRGININMNTITASQQHVTRRPRGHGSKHA
jgi:hypothetical protein